MSQRNKRGDGIQMDGVGKILPQEGYIAQIDGDLSADYTTSLSHLYQPLIGPSAVMLYQTLIHEAELQDQNAQTHHTLMNYTCMALDDIYHIRLRLEGIGLLKTYETEKKNQNVYIYALQCPFSPHNFFLDGMLSQLLYHHVGDKIYQKLEKRFHRQASDVPSKNVTASFHDVFTMHKPYEQTTPASEKEDKNDHIAEEEADLTLIRQMLQQQMIPVQNVMTGTNKRLIKQMMDLYDLADYEIEKALLWALDEANKLHADEFKTACHDLFRAKEQPIQVNLNEKNDTSEQTNSDDYKPTTKEEQLIHNFEKSSPKEVLEDFSKGNTASGQDMKVIRNVMTSQNLPVPVMNVLIHYTLLQSNMKLSKNYLETIASHWSRAQLTTAKEAMAFAKSQKEAIVQKRNQKNQRRKSTSNEVIPDWFQAQEDAKKNDKNDKNDYTHEHIDQEKEVSDVAQLLEEFTNRE